MKYSKKVSRGYSLVSALFIFALVTLLTGTFLAITTQNYADAAHQETMMLADSLANSGLQYGVTLLNEGASFPSSLQVFPFENNQTLFFEVSQTGNILTSTGVVEDSHGTVLGKVTRQETLDAAP